ncbi:MAG: class I SAM-dependent methyltransferase [Gemmatimonadetes bacterium]|nr:class I SAM-dependent methyltransferase [Gemmatimonadota bacterium]
MLTRPACRSVAYAETFKDRSVVAAYRHRPPHPPGTFDLLRQLIVDRPRSLLDAGTGLGDLARALAPNCDRVDAVDFSERMIEMARSLPGGDDPRVRWLCSPIEDADLIGPYSLITAADSLSWFDLNVVIPKFAELLTENGVLAVVGRSAQVGLREDDIIPRYSLNRDYERWDPVAALEKAGLFERLGQECSGPVPWTPTIEEYIERRHSQNGFSRDRMSRRRATDFDAALRARIAEQVKEGSVRMEEGRLLAEVAGSVVWGRPVPRLRATSERGILGPTRQ